MAGLAFFSLPQGTELIIIAVIGLLLFGRKLPEIGRSLGRGIVEFKKGLKGIEDEVEEVGRDARDPRLEADRTAELEANRQNVLEKSDSAVAERTDRA